MKLFLALILHSSLSPLHSSLLILPSSPFVTSLHTNCSSATSMQWNCRLLSPPFRKSISKSLGKNGNRKPFQNSSSRPTNGFQHYLNKNLYPKPLLQTNLRAVFAICEGSAYTIRTLHEGNAKGITVYSSHRIESADKLFPIVLPCLLDHWFQTSLVPNVHYPECRHNYRLRIRIHR